MSQPKLTENLDIVARSPLEITLLEKDLSIIAKLDDEPNDVGGMSAQELKETFDRAGNIIKDYLNESLVPAILAADATEAERTAQETARQENEKLRQEQEALRQSQESRRQAAEQLRAEAESTRAEAEDARESVFLQSQTSRTQAFDAAQAERTQAFDAAQAAREARFSAGEEARNSWENFDPAKPYSPGNKVYYLGSSYVNRSPCSGVLPTDPACWLLIAKKGADSGEGLSQEEADLRYLQLSGGALSGPLSVPEPASDAHAVPKAYADAAAAAALNSARAYADAAVGERVPAGVIVMWSGSAASIPRGWVLCNGTNGTPDLRDRFVVGAGNTYGVGAAGGETMHRLTEAEIPSHSHGAEVCYSGSGDQKDSFDIRSLKVGASYYLNTEKTGGGAAHNNLPPYYALCFILKQ